MPYVNCESSQLHSMNFDAVEQRLLVRFRCPSCRVAASDNCKKCGGKGHNSEYQYERVPQEKYVAVRDGKTGPHQSVGKAFGFHIKRGDYPFKRIS